MGTKLVVLCWRRMSVLLLIVALTSSCIQPIQPATVIPSAVRSEEVTFSNGNIDLAGTLTLPAVGAVHPALILVSGSGQQDRDESIPIIPGYKPFQVIADYLTQQGIAVLRYDDRGVGGSTGDPTTATTADFAQDAEAALNYLRNRSDIDPSMIGLLGHSEGSIIAAMIAARNPNVAFVISMAGPAVSGYDLLLLQTERILSVSGMDAEEVKQAMDDQRQLLALIMAQEWDGLKAKLLETGRQQIEALPEAQKKQIGDPEAFLQKQIDISMLNMQHWMHFFLLHNPADDWRQIKVPVLALFGGLDTQVDQAQNRPAMQAALTQAGNPDVTIKIYPEANHLFQQAKTGSPTEYATLAAQFVPGFLDTIGQWILVRTNGAGLGKTEDTSINT